MNGNSAKRNMDFTQTTSDNFNEFTLSTFHHQLSEIKVYRDFCKALGKDATKISSWNEIPFLPISFFKTHRVCSEKPVVHIFESSGTGGHRSQHLVNDLTPYEQSFFPTFKKHIEKPLEEVSILALLPSYLERNNSSLVYMVNALLPQAHSTSGFFLNDFEALRDQLLTNEKQGLKTLLLGVSFALLDFAEAFPMALKHTSIMETGGMKGRREELTRTELHAHLCKAFQVKEIHSEYGMTELFSQAYSKGKGVFECPPWMKVVCRDIQDPLTLLPYGKRGALNIIDLANQNSCAFIATEDVGIVHENRTFEILGRMNHAEIRGCNLLFSES
jgi:phenylacetate-coenzyme A ligase PaaK-like adenylate-forming protein